MAAVGGRAAAAKREVEAVTMDAAKAQAVLDALDEHGVLVISGDTGCGKSTSVNLLQRL